MLATCDECDGPMIGAITRQKVPQLRCRDGHVAINQELLRAYLLDEIARYARDLTTPTNTAALEQAQEALDAAKHDHQQLATDARLRAAMGDSYVVALEQAQQAVSTAQETFKRRGAGRLPDSSARPAGGQDRARAGCDVPQAVRGSAGNQGRAGLDGRG